MPINVTNPKLLMTMLLQGADHSNTKQIYQLLHQHTYATPAWTAQHVSKLQLRNYYFWREHPWK